MKFETAFELKQKVFVPELNLAGTVQSFHVSLSGIVEYGVRYFDRSEVQIVFFFEDELTAVTESI